MTNPQTLNTGDLVRSPAGRQLEVHDVFVPRHNLEKSRDIPAQFRGMNRKIVVFHNGSMAPLREIQAIYQRCN